MTLLSDEQGKQRLQKSYLTLLVLTIEPIKQLQKKNDPILFR